MTQQLIPLAPIPEQTFRMVLDAIPYSCRVYWSEFDDTIRELAGNDHEGIWYLDLVSDQFTAYGIALVTGCDLLGAFSRTDVIGQLWLVDTATVLSDPTYDSLGTNHQLVYIPLADIPDLVESINGDAIVQP